MVRIWKGCQAHFFDQSAPDAPDPKLLHRDRLRRRACGLHPHAFGSEFRPKPTNLVRRRRKALRAPQSITPP